VLVHQQVEKWGIHAETITARGTEDLAKYLEGKYVRIPADRLTYFQPYLSGQFVLVVAWIASQEELLKQFPQYREQQSLLGARQPALYLEFPTNRAYYPLRPTRVYGDGVIPIRLYVSGYVDPQAPARISGETKTRYYERDEPVEKGPTKFLQSLPPSPFAYTAISIRAPARDFTDDIWFAPREEPPSFKLAQLMLRIGPMIFLLAPILILIISYVAAGLVALWVGKPWSRFAALGFWNLLTAVGLWVALGRLSEERRQGLSRGGFLLRYTVAFYSVSLVAEIPFRSTIQVFNGDPLNILILSLFVAGILLMRISKFIYNRFGARRA